MNTEQPPKPTARHLAAAEEIIDSISGRQGFNLRSLDDFLQKSVKNELAAIIAKHCPSATDTMEENQLREQVWEITAKHARELNEAKVNLEEYKRALKDAYTEPSSPDCAYKDGCQRIQSHPVCAACESVRFPLLHNLNEKLSSQLAAAQEEIERLHRIQLFGHDSFYVDRPTTPPAE